MLDCQLDGGGKGRRQGRWRDLQISRSGHFFDVSLYIDNEVRHLELVEEEE